VVTALRAACAALCVTLAACGSGGGRDSARLPQRLQGGVRLTSPDFNRGGKLPRDVTCDGSGRAPALSIERVPRGAKALLLLVHDPDAPGGDFTHWTVYDIPPSARHPSGTEGLNELDKPGYAPACPPRGDKAHRYVFELYALQAKTGLPAGASPAEVAGAVDRLAYARGVLVARYGR
jgi:Raf kinase inhibitor-like YbhB/YbcL family protein